jgi:serine protease
LFYDDDCGYIGIASTAETDETAPVPSGTRHIIVTAFFGVETDVTLVVTEAAAPEPTPTDNPTPEPTPTEDPYVRHDYSGTLNDPLYADQWNMQKIKAQEAWQVGQSTGYEIIISDVDSGLDLTHPDFDCPGKIILEPGNNTGLGNDAVQDNHGHGTHVQGIAAACSNNGEGVVGVAPDAQLLPVKWDDFATSDNPIADFDKGMADGINFATAHGAHVINLSIGPPPGASTPGPDAYPLTDAALEAARNAGVVVAAAAGNFDQPTCEFPSMSRNVICVVATDRDDQRSDYSDFAVNLDRNGDPEIQPVVAAPGGGGYTAIPCDALIISTWLRGAEGSCSDAAGYDWVSGTSMASPHVAGLAALLYDRLGGVRSKANADLIVQTIVDSVDDLGAPGYDPIFGYGRINALTALQSVDAVPHPTP